MTALHQLILLLTLTLLSHALITTLIPTPTPNHTSNLTYDYDWQCIPKPTRRSPFPKFIDCIHALMQLPRLEGPGSFHNGPPDDPFRLPVEKTVETCAVSVELAHQGSTREAGEWLLMVEAALESGRECLNPGMGMARVVSTGVWVWLGVHRRIVITMGYFGGGGDGGGVGRA